MIAICKKVRGYMLVETSRSFLELTCILEKEDIDKMVVPWRYVIIYYCNASFMIYFRKDLCGNWGV